MHVPSLLTHSLTAAALLHLHHSVNRTLKEIWAGIPGDRSERDFVRQINDAVQFYNNTASSVTSFPPNSLDSLNLPPEIVKQVQRRLSGRAMKGQPNARYLPPLSVGDAVRIDITYEPGNRATLRAKVKTNSYKPSHDQTWSTTIYHIKSINKASNSVHIVEDDSKPVYSYPRGSVLLIPKGTVDTREDLGRVVV